GGGVEVGRVDELRLGTGLAGVHHRGSGPGIGAGDRQQRGGEADGDAERGEGEAEGTSGHRGSHGRPGGAVYADNAARDPALRARGTSAFGRPAYCDPRPLIVCAKASPTRPSTMASTKSAMPVPIAERRSAQRAWVITRSQVAEPALLGIPTRPSAMAWMK